FLNSGWGAAVISGLVALGVLIFIIRAGREPATYEPPVKPAGSTIEMAAEGADFTLSMEQEGYDVGANRITVVMTGKSKGETVSMYNAWHLERLTEEGAVVVGITYTEEVLISAKPAWGEYATLSKSILVEEPLTVGHYRLHATKYDGEKYVSVAWCTFTVGDPGELTWGEDETLSTSDYPPADDRPYTVTTPDSIEYGATGLPITVKAAEPGVDLMPHRKYSIVKLAGPANGEGADWLQSLEAVLVRPDEQNGGYAVYNDGLTLLSPENWLPGLYRLYALNHDGEYVDYCDFTIRSDGTELPYAVSMERVLYTETDTELAILFEAYRPGCPISRGDAWSLWRVEDGERIHMGSQTAEYAIEGAEIAPDEYAVEHFRPTVSLVTGGKHKTLPAGQYELIFSEGRGVTLAFEVIALPEDAIEAGVGSVRGYILKEQNSSRSYLLSGSTYPECHLLIYDFEDLGEAFDELNSGDYVELLAWNFIEPVPPCATVGMVTKLRDGALESIPDIYDELPELYGITPAP
ncbi:MAG: hypothetical protein J6B24_09770, partial [Clostridia bacterium]|nr:hypothetical protein [Clostridia bacterium]